MSQTFYECKPLTDERWGDLEDLFGPKGACGGCWCMNWKVPRKEFDAGKGEVNKKSLRQIVAEGREPGLLAYDGALAVGWMAIEPRSHYPGLERSRILKPLDEEEVWSITCFYTRKEYRKRGVSRNLIEAAKTYVRGRGGLIIESYPVDDTTGSSPAPFVWTGIASAFREAGFEEAARRSEKRPVMRYYLK